MDPSVEKIYVVGIHRKMRIVMGGTGGPQQSCQSGFSALRRSAHGEHRTVTNRIPGNDFTERVDSEGDRRVGGRRPSRQQSLSEAMPPRLESRI